MLSRERIGWCIYIYMYIAFLPLREREREEFFVQHFGTVLQLTRARGFRLSNAPGTSAILSIYTGTLKVSNVVFARIHYYTYIQWYIYQLCFDARGLLSNPELYKTLQLIIRRRRRRLRFCADKIMPRYRNCRAARAVQL